MITEAEKGYFGLEYARIELFAPRQLLLLPSSKLLINLSFLLSPGLAAAQFTVYKRAGSTALSADPAENLISFSNLESQDAPREFTARAAFLSTTIIRIVCPTFPL